MIYPALNQTAVFWGTPVTDGFGKLTFAVPVEISVRWEDKMEQFLSAMGKDELSQSIIYSETDMEPDCYLYLGLLTDLSTEEKANPVLKVTAYPVKQFKKIPDIIGNAFLRKTWL